MKKIVTRYLPPEERAPLNDNAEDALFYSPENSNKMSVGPNSN